MAAGHGVFTRQMLIAWEFSTIDVCLASLRLTGMTARAIFRLEINYLVRVQTIWIGKVAHYSDLTEDQQNNQVVYVDEFCHYSRTVESTMNRFQ